MTTAISAKEVAALRTATGAGMMDCKKALVEAGGDSQKAQELLRQKGLKTADKKADRATSEGRVYSYIHHNQRVGVMIQVACETDFVARGDDFESLCSDLCMHVAATVPSPVAVSASEVPEELIAEERRILMGSEDMANKPEEIKNKIVDGRIDKFIKERALLEQEYVKDPSMTVEDRLKACISKVGENMKVEQFARFELGS
ncbi:MAG: translation elongation factor Ts [Planctomycetes bacterium]|nr:translation elongation factor Ts [Planctomycetota bacterium]MCP4771731.1 translation elongation factor Ts [Planctomycetota bacterium]MCP4859616.1 translation elongation factor Ts [Planctomycetota bacterium]